MSTNYKYLFGPVPSRRLGRSLGIDLTPLKTCSFDCVFCQCGHTKTLTTTRDEYVPFDDVCSEIDRWLAEDGEADVITFAGSGEPTLYSRLGELISYIKEKTDTPVMLLSNGTLLCDRDVRKEAARADIVKVSLSAWDQTSFETTNRPAPGVTLKSTLTGESDFRREFKGQLWLEVFLMEGFNADREQVDKIAKAAASIHADKIHLNTAVRPPADAAVRPVAHEKLDSFRDLFTPRAEVIASFKAAPSNTDAVNAGQLLGLIRRHPATASQMADMFGTKPAQITALLAPLLSSGELKTEARNNEIYYK